MGLLLRPVSLGEANDYVERLHRHHPPVAGWKFGIGVEDATYQLRGVAIVSHPFARHLDDGWTLEVTRCCTDGAKNAPSLLYAAAWRTARAMGFCRLLTYTLDTETGTSLKAAGWWISGQTPPGSWANRPGRGDGAASGSSKLRWEAPGSRKTTRDPLRGDSAFRKPKAPTLFDNVVTEPTEDA